MGGGVLGFKVHIGPYKKGQTGLSTSGPHNFLKAPDTLGAPHGSQQNQDHSKS